MQKRQTHFEQVPLATVQWILEEDARKSKFEMLCKPESKTEEDALLPVAAGNRSRGRK